MQCVHLSFDLMKDSRVCMCLPQFQWKHFLNYKTIRVIIILDLITWQQVCYSWTVCTSSLPVFVVSYVTQIHSCHCTLRSHHACPRGHPGTMKMWHRNPSRQRFSNFLVLRTLYTQELLRTPKSICLLGYIYSLEIKAEKFLCIYEFIKKAIIYYMLTEIFTKNSYVLFKNLMSGTVSFSFPWRAFIFGPLGR